MSGDSGGGSGVFEDLVFVRFNMGEGINLDGQKYKQLLMTVVREYALGDRYFGIGKGEVKVFPDKVFIKGSVDPNEPGKDIELKFPVK